MSETQTMLGQVIELGGAERDAVRIAVAPVTSNQKLAPGQDIGLVPGFTDVVCSADGITVIGIVDPFLKGIVFPGQHFWMFLYPNTITSLKHNWTHPAFEEAAPKPVSKEASEAWLRNFIETVDCPDYDTVIAAAIGDHEKNERRADDPDGYPGYFGSRNDGEYLHFGGRDAHGEIPAEFWDHVEIVTGRKIDSRKRAEYFSCSC